MTKTQDTSPPHGTQGPDDDADALQGLTARELADALGLSLSGAYKLAKQGIAARHADGSFDIEETRARYARAKAGWAERRRRPRGPYRLGQAAVDEGFEKMGRELAEWLADNPGWRP
jgi:hypothetical protein